MHKVCRSRKIGPFKEKIPRTAVHSLFCVPVWCPDFFPYTLLQYIREGTDVFYLSRNLGSLLNLLPVERLKTGHVASICKCNWVELFCMNHSRI